MATMYLSKHIFFFLTFCVCYNNIYIGTYIVILIQIDVLEIAPYVYVFCYLTTLRAAVRCTKLGQFTMAEFIRGSLLKKETLKWVFFSLTILASNLVHRRTVV